MDNRGKGEEETLKWSLVGGGEKGGNDRGNKGECDNNSSL